MSTPCEKNEVINIIRDDVKEVKGDIKTLLEFKMCFYLLPSYLFGLCSQL